MKKIKKNYNYIIYALLLISLCMLFMPCGMFENSIYKSDLYNGFQMFLNNKTNDFQLWKFNFIGIIYLILLISSIVLTFFEKRYKYVNYIAGFLMILSSIFYLLIGNTIKFIQNDMAKDFILLFPFYLGFILNLLAGIIYLLKKWILIKVK